MVITFAAGEESDILLLLNLLVPEEPHQCDLLLLILGTQQVHHHLGVKIIINLHLNNILWRFVDNKLQLDRMVDRVKPWFMVHGLAHGS